MMVSVNNDFAAYIDKIPQTSFAYGTDNISKFRLFLKQLHTRFKNQTLENDIIKCKMSGMV